jgi:hypothetical protein
MILNPSDLLDPAGDISPEMFPEDTPETLSERLAGYLSRAEQMVSSSTLTGETLNAAIRAYAYYLAFRAVHVRLSSMPASVTMIDAGGRSRTQAQIDAFALRAAEYLARFEVLVPAEVPTTAVTAQESIHTRTRVSW